MARRDASSQIMWGADTHHAEGIYGATEMTRRCLTEVLADALTEETCVKAQRVANRPADPPRQRPVPFSPTQKPTLEAQRTGSDTAPSKTQ